MEWPCGGWRNQPALFRFLQKEKYFCSRGPWFSTQSCRKITARCWPLAELPQSCPLPFGKVIFYYVLSAEADKQPALFSGMSQMKFCNCDVNQCFCLLENLNIQFLPNASLFSCQSIVTLFPHTFLTLSLHSWFLWDGKHIFGVFSQTPTYTQVFEPTGQTGWELLWGFLVWPCRGKSQRLVKQHNLDSLQQKKIMFM